MKKKLILIFTYLTCAILLCGTLTYSWFSSKSNVSNFIHTNGDITIENVDMTFYKFIPGNSNEFPIYVERYFDDNGIVISNSISLENGVESMGDQLVFDDGETFANALYDTEEIKVDNIDVDKKYPFSLGVYDPYLQFVYGLSYENAIGETFDIDYHTRLVIKVDVEVQYTHNYDFSVIIDKTGSVAGVDEDLLSKYVYFSSVNQADLTTLSESPDNRETYNTLTDYVNDEKNNVTKNIFSDTSDQLEIYNKSDVSDSVISFYIVTDYDIDKIYNDYKDYNKEAATTLVGGYSFNFTATQSNLWGGNE